HLEKAVSIYPRFQEAWLKLGLTYMNLTEGDKAEASLNRALELDPKNVKALFALGELYREQKRYAEAEKKLRSGLGIENRSWEGHFTLGRLYWDQSELIKAARQVAISIQLNPNFADAHLLGANILLRSGKREEARLEFEEYLRLSPKGEFAA